jgi:hypothetical protein
MPNGDRRSQHVQSSHYHPAFAGPALFTIEQRPGDDDEQNTAQTVDRMAEYIRADSLHPIVRRAAHTATRGAGADVRGSIHSWIRSHVEFVYDAELAKEISGDPLAAEVLVRPVDLLTMPRPQGDCDDQSMLCAAMLRALGVKTWLKTVAADPEDTSRYSHVYVIADGPGGAMALDCSHGPYPGWEVAAAGKTKLWPVEETNMQGLRAIDWNQTIQTLTNSATDILGARYGVPQTAPGQTYSTKDMTVTQFPPGTGYATLNRRLFLVGGSYEVRPEGIVD